MDLEGDALANDVEDREEAEPVLVIGEDVSVIVAPQDVINCPGYMDSALLDMPQSYPEISTYQHPVPWVYPQRCIDQATTSLTRAARQREWMTQPQKSTQ